MASYFFDTSALVRRYLAHEPGHQRVSILCQPTSGHRLIVTPLIPVEVASAFRRSNRRGEIDERLMRRYWRSFQRHYRQDYRAVELDHLMLEHAAHLVLMHSVRAYDAVHLAAALQVRTSGGLTLDLRFCTADANQAAAADREGLAVELIA